MFRGKDQEERVAIDSTGPANPVTEPGPSFGAVLSVVGMAKITVPEFAPSRGDAWIEGESIVDALEGQVLLTLQVFIDRVGDK